MTSLTESAAKRLSNTGGKFGGVQIKEFDSDTLQRHANPNKRGILKVAISLPEGSTQLYEINCKDSLNNNIRDICQRWNVANAEWYALKNVDTKQYVTEKNRADLHDGNVLSLVYSATKNVEDVLHNLQEPEKPEDLYEALTMLVRESADVTFAQAFVQSHGLKLLVGNVENDLIEGRELADVLTAILEIVDHGIVNIDYSFSREFIRKVAVLADKSTEIDATILQRSLGILELAVIHSNILYRDISEVIKVENLISHLQKSNAEIQQNTIALINGLFLRASVDRGKIGGRRKISDTMAQKQFRSVILNHVIRTSKTIQPEMAHQLYVLQVLTLNMFEERMTVKLQPHMHEDMEKLKELSSIALESIRPDQVLNPLKKQPSFSPTDFRKLGFSNYNNPVMDFEQTPPGVLCLDFMIYFARTHQDNFVRLVLENISRGEKHECPFGRSSIHITRMLCEILKIGQQPTETGQDYHPMFFAHDHAFEELYCICVQLFNKTWKEMSAIKDDFAKVVDVVHDQIQISLNNKPPSLDTFKQRLPSYSEILKKREQERVDKDQFESQAKPIVELQATIEPDIVEVIKQQRLTLLKNGCTFYKTTAGKRRDKSRWFCRLSPNHKFFYYGDLEDGSSSQNTEVLPETLPFSDVKDLVTGKNCPHVKNARATQKMPTELAFSVLYDPDESLNFIAPNDEVWCAWTDGISALLGKKMTSAKAKADFDVLMRMEMKLRLLDLENIPIPEQPPTIPPLPDNYDFVLTM